MEKNKILIVDDVEINREMLTLMLQEQYDFCYASNGLEAIEILESSTKVDLILLDVHMPTMDGFEVLKIMNERHWIEETPVIIISSEDSDDFMVKAYELGVVDYIGRPFRSVIVKKRVENTLIMYSKQKRLVNLVKNEIYEREKNSNAMINIFSNIIELRNHESGSHTLSVQAITNLLLHKLVTITDKYNLSKEDIALISSLATLHDIGKIKIPEQILNKPGKLTNDEWEIMKSHTVEGDLILQKSSLDQTSKFYINAHNICRFHHEKYDGKGYPDGLKGDEIPIAAQVVSLADVYDALTSVRCYKDAFTHEKAIQMILDGDCGVFNPILLKCLREISNELKKLKENILQGEKYDFLDEIMYVGEETLNNNNLPKTNALRRLLENEKRKKEFFMNCCDDIVFEYDVNLHKATFANLEDEFGEKRKVIYTTRDGKDNILGLDYWEKAHEMLQKTTKENPIVNLDVNLKIKDKLMPYKASFMALWPEEGNDYISVLGCFTSK